MILITHVGLRVDIVL